MHRQVVGDPSLEVSTTSQCLGATEGNFGVGPALSRELGGVTSTEVFPPKRFPKSKTSNNENLNYRKDTC